MKLARADQSDQNSEESKRVATAIDRYYAKVTDARLTHVPVNLDLVLLHKMPDVALYLSADDSLHIAGTQAPDPEQKYRIFRNRGLYLSQVEVDNLARNNIEQVYIERSDVPVFTQYVEGLLQELGTNSPIIDDQKVTLLRTSAINVMADLFASPTPENIERGVKVVSNFVYVLMRDPKAYQLLLSLSSHDHYTLQHSVGVATNAIILAKKVGITEEKSLIEVGLGGLLHDIGKTKIPKEVINKKGPLDEQEWAQMKKHSLFGYEILKDNTNVGTRAKLAVLEHHEDTNGTGYPMGISSGQVSLFAKIVTVADIYNAITTDRSYSSAKPPFEAFKIMKDKLFHKVDPKLFEAMVLIYGGKTS